MNPKGGDTEFADMRAAYDALDDETKREIEDLVCEHSLMYSRGSLGFLDYTDEEKEMFKPVRQRLVRTHPVTGRKSLYLSSHAGAILGMPMPEARILLRDLTEHATQPRFVYVHKWRPTTWSCGTTARPCTAAAATTRRSRATCAAPRWPATRRLWRRPPSRRGKCDRQTSAQQTVRAFSVAASTSDLSAETFSVSRSHTTAEKSGRRGALRGVDSISIKVERHAKH